MATYYLKEEVEESSEFQYPKCWLTCDLYSINQGRLPPVMLIALNDGGSAVLMTSESVAKQNGWEIIAFVEDYCTSGVEPHRVMSAPIPAIKTLLERNSLEVLDVDVYEHNEAFASASCLVLQENQHTARSFQPSWWGVSLVPW